MPQGLGVRPLTGSPWRAADSPLKAPRLGWQLRAEESRALGNVTLGLAWEIRVRGPVQGLRGQETPWKTGAAGASLSHPDRRQRLPGERPRTAGAWLEGSLRPPGAQPLQEGRGLGFIFSWS